MRTQHRGMAQGGAHLLLNRVGLDLGGERGVQRGDQARQVRQHVLARHRRQLGQQDVAGHLHVIVVLHV